MASIFRGPLFASRQRGPRIAHAEQQPNFLALQTGPLFPFALGDLQNPLRRRQVGETTLATNLLLTVLSVAVADPFLPVDWPSQEARRSVQVDQQYNLLAGGQFEPLQPFALADWPNPQRAARADLSCTWAALPGAQAEIPFVAGEAGEVQRRERFTQHDAQPNLAALFAQIESPFPGFDHQGQVKRRASEQYDDGPISLLARGLFDTPFVSGDWPDYPRRISPLHDVGRSAFHTTLAAPAVGDPFVPSDLPQPVRAEGRAQPDQEQAIRTLVVPTGPFAPIDTSPLWPNRRRAQQPDQHGNAISTTLALVGGPFRVSEWPVPSAQRYAQHDYAQALMGATLAPQLQPFSLLEWPVPYSRKSFSPDDQPQDLFTTTLFVDPGPQPFAQHDWPHPIMRNRHEITLTSRYVNLPTLATFCPSIAIMDMNRTIAIVSHKTIDSPC